MQGSLTNVAWTGQNRLSYLAGDFMDFKQGFQEKYILNFWYMLFHSTSVSLKVIAILFRILSEYCETGQIWWISTTVHCRRHRHRLRPQCYLLYIWLPSLVTFTHIYTGTTLEIALLCHFSFNIVSYYDSIFTLS